MVVDIMMMRVLSGGMMLMDISAELELRIHEMRIEIYKIFLIKLVFFP